MAKPYPTLIEALFPNEKKRGGRRPGAGRKRKYSGERVSIRCGKEHVDIVRKLIEILDSGADTKPIMEMLEHYKRE